MRTVSALDARGADHRADGLYQVESWVAATRNFLGHGAWDEYGRRLDGFRTTDLVGYATRIIDDIVEIGSPVPAPAGSPITSSDDTPAMSNVNIEPGPVVGVDQAVALPVGTTVWIDANVYALPDRSEICSDADLIEPTNADASGSECPEGSPIANGIVGEPGYGNVYFGRLLATRTTDGFETIASTGGYGSTAL